MRHDLSFGLLTLCSFDWSYLSSIVDSLLLLDTVLGTLQDQSLLLIVALFFFVQDGHAIICCAQRDALGMRERARNSLRWRVDSSSFKNNIFNSEDANQWARAVGSCWCVGLTSISQD